MYQSLGETLYQTVEGFGRCKSKDMNNKLGTISYLPAMKISWNVFWVKEDRLQFFFL